MIIKELVQIYNLDEDSKFHLACLVYNSMSTPSKEARFKIKNNLIESFKDAHND